MRAAVAVASGDFVLVHDAARPCLAPEVTRRVVQSAVECGAAIAALPADDTVKRVVGEGDATFIEETIDRSRIYLAQTPQMFRRDWLLQAFDFAANEQWQGTDCASFFEHWAQCNPNRVLDEAPEREVTERCRSCAWRCAQHQGDIRRRFGARRALAVVPEHNELTGKLP